MRRLVTFILRLWIEPEADPRAWEGRVECVGTGQMVHVRGEADLARFLAGSLAQTQAAVDPAPDDAEAHRRSD